MGDDGEIIASKYGVTREETDAFAARSHQLASKANKNGAFLDIVEVSPPLVPSERTEFLAAEMLFRVLHRFRTRPVTEQ